MAQSQTIGRSIMERQAQTIRLHELLKDANLACGQDCQSLGGTCARSSLTFRLFLCVFFIQARVSPCTFAVFYTLHLG